MPFLEALQQIQRVLIIGAGPGLPVQPRHGFQIVIEHIGRLPLQKIQRHVHPSAKIRDQSFDDDARLPGAHRPDAVREMRRAAVAQIVAIHRGDDHILQAHRRHGPGQMFRFWGVERVRPTVAHVAERTAPGADVAHDHESGRAVAEAFAEIGATGFFTDRVQMVVPQNLLQPHHFRRAGERGANPGRFTQALLGIAGRDLDRDAGDFFGAAQFLALLGSGFRLAGAAGRSPEDGAVRSDMACS
jgi:hypothetical protein